MSNVFRSSLLVVLGLVLAASVSSTETTSNVAFANQLPISGSSSIADAAAKSVPSVVNIFSKREVKRQMSPFFNDPFFNHPNSPFGMERRGEPRYAKSLGSGVIVSKQGHILTNAHVIKDASEIRVALHNGKEYDAKIVGADPMSDVAVIKLTKPPRNLKPATFADSDKVRLGEVVIAIGNPFGVGQAVTMGIISAKGRAGVGIVRYEDYIQTDAAINPGNSGGGLINMRGQLVGINTAILSKSGGYQGIGFAIPSNMAKKIMNGLIAGGTFKRGYLGIYMAPLDSENATLVGTKRKKGVIVAKVVKGGAGAKAGLRERDIIISANGTEISSGGELSNFVAMQGVGSKLTLVVDRGGKTIPLTARLGELDEKKLSPNKRR